jgi:outer membrane protein
MKKSFFFLILGIMFLGQRTYGQKFGYIDTEFITSKMPEYQKVQEVLNEKTKAWIKEVTDKQALVVQMEKEYHLEELLLTDELRQQKLAAIKAKDLELKSFQERVFGDEGELFKAKQNAMKPILDEISKALERVVRQKRLDFVFDKANDGLALIYTNPIHDYSDYVLEELGLELDPNLKK